MSPTVSTIPEKTIRNIILTTLLTRGGEAEPSDVYVAVETSFPRLTEKAAKNLPYNTRWSRKGLVTDGLISDRVRGLWRLTAKGRKEAITVMSA